MFQVGSKTKSISKNFNYKTQMGEVIAKILFDKKLHLIHKKLAYLDNLCG